MSHSVTVTRTTTTTTTSAILINTGYYKTYPGILKLLELLIGIVVVGIVAHYYPNPYGRSAEVFFLTTAVACLLGTACLLTSCTLSPSSATILPKTLFEVTFHSVAFVLYLAASITFLMNVENYYHSSYRTTLYEPLLAASVPIKSGVASILLTLGALVTLGSVLERNSGYPVKERAYTLRICTAILGLINAALYLVSTVFAYRSYKGK